MVNDQTSLGRLVSPGHNEYGLSVKELPDRWNARNLPRYRLRVVVVDHAARHKIDGRRVARFLASRRLGFLDDASREPRRTHRSPVWSAMSRLVGALTSRTKHQ
jgi:hypothetical protein